VRVDKIVKSQRSTFDYVSAIEHVRESVLTFVSCIQ
jgi:hypothetical protein